MTRTQLLLADDHKLMLEGLCSLLERDFELVGTAEDGRALVAAAEELKPDVILLDISMPLLNGLDAARQLKKRLPGVRLIFVTMHADADYVREAFRAGAAGYILKRSAGSELVTAVREVMRGHFYVTPLVARDVVDSIVRSGAERKSQSRELTSREREVLQLVAEGHLAKQIANILHLSTKTIEYHKSRIMRSLGLYSTAELTRYAIEHGLIGNDEARKHTR